MLIVWVVIAVVIFVVGGRILRMSRRAQDSSVDTQPPPRAERRAEPARSPGSGLPGLGSPSLGSPSLGSPSLGSPTAVPPSLGSPTAGPSDAAPPRSGSRAAVQSGAGWPRSGPREAPPANSGLAPRANLPAQAAPDAAWSEAQRLRALLLARQVPLTIPVWEVVPEPGEVFFYDVPVDYERYYGRDVSYRPASGFFLGSPAFILAGLAVNSVTNASRRNAAEAEARMQWREGEHIRLIVSNHRLLCLVRGQWVSFHYAAMTAVYPEVAQWALVAEFQGIPPLRLRGVDAPIAAVMTVFATHGLPAVAEHPSLQALGPVPPAA